MTSEPEMLTVDSRLLVMGNNSFGSAGVPDQSTHSIKQATLLLLDDQLVIKDVSSSYRHTLMVDNQGRVWAWGYTKYGRLGLGGEVGEFACCTPSRIPSFPGLPVHSRVLQVSCGYGHSAAVTSAGLLYTWGFSADGQLGLECAAAAVESPRLVPGVSEVRHVSCGPRSTLLLTHQGSLMHSGVSPDPSCAPSVRCFSVWRRHDTVTSIYAQHKHWLLVTLEEPLGCYCIGEAHQGTALSSVSPSPLRSVKNSERFMAALDVEGRLFLRPLHTSCRGQLNSWALARTDVSSFTCGTLSVLVVTTEGLVEHCVNLGDWQRTPVPDSLPVSRVFGNYRTFFLAQQQQRRSSSRDACGALRGTCISRTCPEECGGFAGPAGGLALNSPHALQCLRCGCSSAQHLLIPEEEEEEERRQVSSSLGVARITLGNPGSSAQISSMHSGLLEVTCAPGMRVYCVSDLHTDFKGNMLWLKDLQKDAGQRHRGDCLIVAGDVSHVMHVIEETLVALQHLFAHVFHVCGNHEMWVAPRTAAVQHGLDKMLQVQRLCARLGVHTGAVLFNGELAVLPLISWYHPQFDGRSHRKFMPHFDAACRWTDSDDQLARQMMSFNAPVLEEIKRIRPERVVSFSHFLPRRELFRGNPAMAEVMGCSYIEEALREARSSVHVFGHSHLDVDRIIDGVRYVQHALGSSRSQRTESSFPQYLPKQIV